MSRASSVSGGADVPGWRRFSLRAAWARGLSEWRGHGWMWRLSMLWVALGAGGALYGLVCTFSGCTTVQCTNDEFWFPLYNGEPAVVTDAGGLSAGIWVLMTVPLLVAGFIWLRGWRRRQWLRAMAWAGTWLAGLVLMLSIAVAGAWGADYPGWGWGEFELPIFALWLGLGALMSSVLVRPPARERHRPETSGG